MQDLLSNLAVDVGDLPRLTESEFSPIERKYLWSRLLVVGAFGAALMVAFGVAVSSDLATSNFQVEFMFLAVAIAVFGLAVLQWLDVKHMGFLVREHDFSFRRGVIRRSVITIPFSRVQNVTLDRGPLVRALGLASLRLSSAGGGLTVVGLTADEAQHLKSFVVDKARVAADEEQAARR